MAVEGKDGRGMCNALRGKEGYVLKRKVPGKNAIVLGEKEEEEERAECQTAPHLRS